MKLHKLLALILSAVLLLSLVACRKSSGETLNSVGLPILSSASKKQEIKKEYEKQVGIYVWDGWCNDDGVEKANGIQYYGTYRNAIVFFAPPETCETVISIIAGMEFVADTRNLHVYKSRTFYNLEEAYNLELLTQEDIQQIHEYHMLYRDWISGKIG